MSQTYTTREIAEFLGCSIQAVCRARREAEQTYGKPLGKPHTSDKRLTIFDETEREAILEFAPKAKVKRETIHEFVEGELMSEPTEVVNSGAIARVAQPLMGFGGIQTLNINISVASTTALEDETKMMQQVTAQSFGALQQLITSDLKAVVNETIAQNRHAVAGIQAVAAHSVASELGKPNAASESQH